MCSAPPPIGRRRQVSSGMPELRLGSYRFRCRAKECRNIPRVSRSVRCCPIARSSPDRAYRQPLSKARGYYSRTLAASSAILRDFGDSLVLSKRMRFGHFAQLNFTKFDPVVTQPVSNRCPKCEREPAPSSFRYRSAGSGLARNGFRRIVKSSERLGTGIVTGPFGHGITVRTACWVKDRCG